MTHLFLVMDLVKTDLKNLLNTVPKIRLDDEHIKTIMFNILMAVTYLHSANIMHRDIKPSNFLID